MWHIITEQQREEARKNQERIFERMREEGEEKRKAREAHEARKCPHCGRNDPLPPWLM